MSPDEAAFVESYSEEVLDTFTAKFEADDRFPDWSRLARRFREATNSVLKHGFSKFSAVEATHNELCIAEALLASEKPRFARLDYEPALNGYNQSIDFRATAENGLTLFVDVKTIQPESKDKWDQFQTAKDEQRFPDNIIVALRENGLGGELWHSMFAPRGRILEYTRKLERKIADGSLVRTNTFFILALCGEGFDWREAELENFVAFYRTGVHRPDDKFSKMELEYIRQKAISLTRTITQFACMRRTQGGVQPEVNWNVSAPGDKFVRVRTSCSSSKPGTR
ncbi:MAG TPA: hypothetical protein VK493_04420 [Bryobacteraceae bacterium]|nr:hypothetical protein [Bryobacteraceae bacterium]